MSAYSIDQKIPQRLALYPTDAKDEIRFEVTAVAHRKAYGRDDFYIRPRRGVGGKWVSESNLDWIS